MEHAGSHGQQRPSEPVCARVAKPLLLCQDFSICSLNKNFFNSIANKSLQVSVYRIMSSVSAADLPSPRFILESRFRSPETFSEMKQYLLTPKFPRGVEPNELQLGEARRRRRRRTRQQPDSRETMITSRQNDR